jgi:hypothetical protein
VVTCVTISLLLPSHQVSIFASHIHNTTQMSATYYISRMQWLGLLVDTWGVTWAIWRPLFYINIDLTVAWCASFFTNEALMTESWRCKSFIWCLGNSTNQIKKKSHCSVPISGVEEIPLFNSRKRAHGCVTVISNPGSSLLNVFSHKISYAGLRANVLNKAFRWPNIFP